MIKSFCRYELRTTDVDAARRFYADVLDHNFVSTVPSEEPSMLAIWPLHEQARARGAPAHWLGSIGVGNLEESVQQLVELGAEPLGPMQLRGADGIAFAILRDPVGALIALREESRSCLHSPVAWHHLHTRNLEKAWTTYADLFGWTRERSELLTEFEGRRLSFAYDQAGVNAGSMADVTQRPEVHVHWMYFFRVVDINAASAKVLAHGGRVIGSASTLANGDVIWPCEDAQGAAFGLYQRRVHDV